MVHDFIDSIMHLVRAIKKKLMQISQCMQGQLLSNNIVNFIFHLELMILIDSCDKRFTKTKYKFSLSFLRFFSSVFVCLSVCVFVSICAFQSFSLICFLRLLVLFLFFLSLCLNFFRLFLSSFGSFPHFFLSFFSFAITVICLLFTSLFIFVSTDHSIRHDQ